MLTPEELQMVADAERSLKLQKAASDGPWLDDDGTIVDELGGVVAFVQPHGNVNTVARTGEHYSKSDAAFIINSRTDPSAANVLTLAETVRRLRKRLRSLVAHPSASGGFHSQKRLDDVLTVQDRERTARDIIDACRIHGVEVPEHLKPYENERGES